MKKFHVTLSIQSWLYSGLPFPTYKIWYKLKIEIKLCTLYFLYLTFCSSITFPCALFCVEYLNMPYFERAELKRVLYVQWRLWRGCFGSYHMLIIRCSAFVMMLSWSVLLSYCNAPSEMFYTQSAFAGDFSHPVLLNCIESLQVQHIQY
jgi:hypothetical protein